jgi:hypothetical protein
VGEDDELPVEEIALAQATNSGGHAVAAHAVEARLRAVGVGVELDGLVGCHGQALGAELLAQGLEVGPGGEDLFSRGFGLELDGDALGVAVLDGHAVAVGADFGVEHLDVGVVDEAAE